MWFYPFLFSAHQQKRIGNLIGQVNFSESDLHHGLLHFIEDGIIGFLMKKINFPTYGI